MGEGQGVRVGWGFEGGGEEVKLKRWVVVRDDGVRWRAGGWLMRCEV